MALALTVTGCGSGAGTESGVDSGSSSGAEAVADVSAESGTESGGGSGSSEGLPAYVYEGDAETAAICDYLTNVVAKDCPEADVSIPYMRIVDRDESDPEDTVVRGDFWVMNYNLEGDVLEMDSGGDYPGAMHLEKNSDGSFTVTDFDAVGDGSLFEPSARRIFGDKYDEFMAAQSDRDTMEEIRADFIRDYVKANGLNITAYKDYGWDPIKLR